MFLLDTNVVSELNRPRPDLQVTEWFRSVPQDLLYLSVISLAELIRGVQRHHDPVRRASLQAWLDHEMRIWLDKGLISFTIPIAEAAGSLTAQRDLLGRPITFPDAGIAATAIVHDLILVSRNTKDFEGLPLRILNPWIETIPGKA